jgi:hypothetical protein
VAIAKALPPLGSDSALSTPSTAWLLAPLACGLASAAMLLSGTVHPPGGATAVLAVTDAGLRGLGWNLIPLVAVACAIMLGVAVLGGNVLRRYPVYWWSVRETGAWWKSKEDESKETERSGSVGSVGSVAFSESGDDRNDLDLVMILSRRGIVVPPELVLDETEVGVLKGIMARLNNRAVKTQDIV